MKQVVYKTEIRKFFDMEGRFISVDNGSWLACKDMFNWLGRVKADGTWTNERNKMVGFLKNINKKEYHQTFVVLIKQGKAKVEKEMEFIKIDVVPMVLTQFEPTARVSKERHQQWCELMKFINAILEELEVYKFITEDKKHQNRTMERLQKLLPQELDNPSSYKRVNSDIAKILQVLSGTSVPIYKPMIQEKICEHTKEVLLEREEVLEAYINAYEMFGDFDYAKAMTIQIIKKRYSL